MKYVALLRGINVSGKHSILMKDLKLLFQDLGFENIKTYIQSGNVVFESKKKEVSTLSKWITAKIKEDYNYDIPVIIKTLEEIQAIYDVNPFFTKNVDIKKLYVVYLSKNPLDVKNLTDCNFKKDTFKIIKNVLYIKYDIGAGKTKLTNSLVEKKLNVVATSRNWRTTTKLLEIMVQD